MTIARTDAFVSTTMGMNGNLVRRDVPLSAVALASYMEYGDEPWTEYSESAMNKLARDNGWTVNIYSDEPDFNEDWARFCRMVNAALLVIASAVRDINLGNL